MNRSSISHRLPRGLFLGTLLVLGACKATSSHPDRAEISSTATATAEVEKVDPSTRMLTLRREDGQLFDVLAGEAVRNFDRIAVGDALRVRYEERLAASLRPEGEGARAMEGALAAGRAPKGAKPGAGMGVAVSVSVRIESIDLRHDIVVFSLASGELIAHRIATPEGRDFVAGLALGDTVQLDYTQALALSVEEL